MPPVTAKPIPTAPIELRILAAIVNLSTLTFCNFGPRANKSWAKMSSPEPTSPLVSILVLVFRNDFLLLSDNQEQYRRYKLNGGLKTFKN